jgi:hypothetical protein
MASAQSRSITERRNNHLLTAQLVNDGAHQYHCLVRLIRQRDESSFTARMLNLYPGRILRVGAIERFLSSKCAVAWPNCWPTALLSALEALYPLELNPAWL